MPIPMKGTIYKIAVQPAMTYGAECWPIKKQQADKILANEMRMLRWSVGVPMLDKVLNHYITDSNKTNATEAYQVPKSVEHMTKKVL